MSEQASACETFLEKASIEDLTFFGDETPEQFADVLRNLYDEVKPAGFLEENQVFRIAKAIWTRTRFDRSMQVKMFDHLLHNEILNLNIEQLEKMKIHAEKFLKCKSVKEVEALIAEHSFGYLISRKWPLRVGVDPNS